MATQIVRSKERIRKTAEIFTPPWMVENMCDMVEQNNSQKDDPFAPDKTFFEPSCGDGNIITIVLRRRLERCNSREEAIVSLGHTYGADIMADNVQVCRERMYEVFEKFYPAGDDVRTILENTVIQADFFLLAPCIKRADDWDDVTILYDYYFGDVDIPNVTWMHAANWECKRLKKTSYKASREIVQTDDLEYMADICRRYAATLD